MADSMESMLTSLKDEEFKRKLLDERIGKLSPELRVEMATRRSLLLRAMRQHFELPRESQPLFQAIAKITKHSNRPLWIAIVSSAIVWLVSRLLNREGIPSEYLLVFLGAAATYHIDTRIDILEMKRRFDCLKDKIEEADSILYTYGRGYLDSFGPWDKRNVDLPLGTESLLTEAKFFNDLDESILVNMKMIGSMDLTLKLHNFT